MEQLFKKLDIKPNNIELYETAFSHSSYSYENNLKKKNYERMEFLGDAVLDVIVSDYLYKNTNEAEGEMTKIRASYVCENALSTYASDYGFSKYIKVGHGEEEDGGRYKKVILADIFEAFIGAMYLDLGFAKTKEKTLEIIVPYIEDESVSFFNDYKSILQEYVQTEQKSVKYNLVSEEGPAHNKTWTVQVIVDDIVYGEGSSGSKKEAEQEAAKNALDKLAI